MPFLTHVIPPIGTEAITCAAGNSSFVAFLFETHDTYSIYKTNTDPDLDIPIILTVVYKVGTSFEPWSGSGAYTAPSAGIYLWPDALGDDNDKFGFSISWEQERIDPKVLPDGGFGYVDNDNIILPETALSLQKDTEADVDVIDVIYGYYTVVDGHEYFINFDDTAYPVTATKRNEGDYTLRSDECPITVWVIHSQGVDAIAFSADQSYIGTHTVSITTGIETIHKIDPKFLPDDIALKDDLLELYNVLAAQKSQVQIITWTGNDIGGGFTKLDYIESTGTQYIDTGISGGSSAAYEIVFDPLAGWVNNYEQYFAGTNCNTPKLFHKFHDDSGARNDVICESDDWAGRNPSLFAQDSGKHTVTFDGVDMWVDGAKAGYWTPTPGGWGATNWYVFSSSSEPNLCATMRLYSLKMYKDGILARDFVPARRDSDGSIGLYDFASDTFFENAGAGEFIGG